MKKLIIITLLTASAIIAKAQTTNKTITEHDPKVKAVDSTINADIIQPARDAAGDDAPDWADLSKTITAKYDAVTADRTITKAKIYFYYGKDWPAFCGGIVHYTNNWELANDYKLLSGNAKMILDNSTDQSQLKEAQKWAKMAMDEDKSNADYKATYDALTAKISGN